MLSLQIYSQASKTTSPENNFKKGRQKRPKINYY